MNITLAAPLEIKSLGPAETGEFSGYGAIFHSVDQVGDRILPGAFTETLAEQKATGRKLPMHFNHGLPELGGVRGVGVWNVVEQDENGLRVEGKISGMNTDAGRLLYERVRDGAIGGLSIGFRVRGNGAVYGRSAGEPRRTIKAATLREISVVDDPCHPMARADNFKATDSEVRTAIRWLRAAIALHERHMSGDAPTTGAAGLRSQQDMMDQMRSALAALTDDAEPSRMSGMKALPQFREFRDLLREQWDFSRSQAEHIAEFGYKSLLARESADGEAMTDEAKAALDDIRATARAFSLPSF